MNDSRLDRIAEMAADGQVEKDQKMLVWIASDALREWVEFMEGFPFSDSEIGVVAVRLRAALRHAEIGNDGMARASFRLAGKAIEVVKNR